MIYIAKVNQVFETDVSVMLPFYRKRSISCDLRVTTVYEKIVGKQKCDSTQEITCYSVSITDDTCAQVNIINNFSFAGESDPIFINGIGKFKSTAEEFKHALDTAKRIIDYVSHNSGAT